MPSPMRGTAAKRRRSCVWRVSFWTSISITPGPFRWFPFYGQILAETPTRRSSSGVGVGGAAHHPALVVRLRPGNGRQRVNLAELAVDVAEGVRIGRFRASAEA